MVASSEKRSANWTLTVVLYYALSFYPPTTLRDKVLLVVLFHRWRNSLKSGDGPFDLVGPAPPPFKFRRCTRPENKVTFPVFLTASFATSGDVCKSQGWVLRYPEVFWSACIKWLGCLSLDSVFAWEFVGMTVAFFFLKRCRFWFRTDISSENCRWQIILICNL